MARDGPRFRTPRPQGRGRLRLRHARAASSLARDPPASRRLDGLNSARLSRAFPREQFFLLGDRISGVADRQREGRTVRARFVLDEPGDNRIDFVFESLQLASHLRLQSLVRDPDEPIDLFVLVAISSPAETLEQETR